MTNKQTKPKMNSIALVNKLKVEKGITFKYISEMKAAEYLSKNNNYMRTASYRKNYQKYLLGKNKGKYIDLDFSYLQELSIIDMHLRNILIKMCIDIEHAIKVRLIEDLENNNSSDGYDIVNSFLDNNKNIVKELECKSESTFIGDLINKYFILNKVVDANTGRIVNKIVQYDCPVWVLLELLSFGDTIRFYQYYNKKYNIQNIIPVNILNLVRNLRNGVAHNSCLLVDLNKGVSKYPREISDFVSKIPEIKQNQRKKKLSCRFILEFTSVLFVYVQVVSPKIKEHGINSLKTFANGRMMEKIDFFKKNQLIISTFDYIKKLVNNLK